MHGRCERNCEPGNSSHRQQTNERIENELKQE